MKYIPYKEEFFSKKVKVSSSNKQKKDLSVNNKNSSDK